MWARSPTMPLFMSFYQELEEHGKSEVFILLQALLFMLFLFCL